MSADHQVVIKPRGPIELPESLSDLETAARFLMAMARDQKEIQLWDATFPFHYRDVAVNLDRYLCERYGAVAYGNAHRETVDLGRLGMVSAPVRTQLAAAGLNIGLTVVPQEDGYGNEDVTKGKLIGEGQARFRSDWEDVISGLTDQLAQHSIYRGAAWSGPLENPVVMDMSGFDPSSIFYSEEAMANLQAFLWGPIMWPEATRRLGIPMRRSILLHGPFGTGKSAAAWRTAQLCEQSPDWTFIGVRPGVDDLLTMLEQAAYYRPCVLFIEDLESVVGAGPHDGPAALSAMLEAFDGLSAKTARDSLILLLTSNHPERLYEGMTRPGRIDKEILIGAPDAAAIRGIVTHRIGDYLDDSVVDADWTEITDAMEGYLPAFVSQTADQAKSYALARCEGDDTSVHIGALDLIDSANGMRSHRELMTAARESASASAMPTIDTAIRSAVASAVEDLGLVQRTADAVPETDRFAQVTEETSEAGADTSLSKYDFEEDAYDGSYRAIGDTH